MTSPTDGEKGPSLAEVGGAAFGQEATVSAANTIQGRFGPSPIEESIVQMRAEKPSGTWTVLVQFRRQGETDWVRQRFEGMSITDALEAIGTHASRR